MIEMFRLFIKSVTFFSMAWLIGLIFFNRCINSYIIDDSTHTDAVIALTGGRNRIPEAVNLLNQGKADKLFISGVQKDISLKEIASRKDVIISTDREITVDNKSKNTIENAIETTQWIEKNDIKSIRLVTSNYHIPRSLEEFKANNKNITILIHPVYSEKVSPNLFKNWGTFSLIASEYNKFIFVYFKYLFKRELS